MLTLMRMLTIEESVFRTIGLVTSEGFARQKNEARSVANTKPIVVSSNVVKARLWLNLAKEVTRKTVA